MDPTSPITGVPVSNMNAVNPAPAQDALEITGIVKKKGRITGYQLSDGQLINKEQGVEMAKQSRIKGVAVATNQGTEYLRGMPDDRENNNLGTLPTVDAEIS